MPAVNVRGKSEGSQSPTPDQKDSPVQMLSNPKESANSITQPTQIASSNDLSQSGDSRHPYQTCCIGQVNQERIHIGNETDDDLQNSINNELGL